MRRLPCILGAMAATLLYHGAVAQTVNWSPTAGPYGGPISNVVLDSSGNSYAVAGGAVFKASGSSGNWHLQIYANVAIQDIAASADGILIAGTEGGGVIRSLDAGAHWEQSNDGITTSFIWGVTVAPNGDYFAASQFGALYRSVDHGQNWTTIASLPQNVYPFKLAANAAGDLFIGTTSKGVFVASNDGGTWNVSSLGIDEGITGLAAITNDDLFVGTAIGHQIVRFHRAGTAWQRADTATLNGQPRSIIPVPGSAGSILAGASFGLYRSDDAGHSWARIDVAISKSPASGFLLFPDGSMLEATSSGVNRASGPLGPAMRFQEANTGLTMQSVRSLIPAKGGAILAGTLTGGIFRSSDGGASWIQVRDVPESFTSNGYAGVNGFARGRDGELYASTYGGGLFHSGDDGVTWSRTGGALPDSALVAVAADSAGGVLAAVASNGLYRSTDKGANWTKLPFGQDYAYPVVVAPNGTILAGSFSASYQSTDNGQTWSAGPTFDINVESILPTAAGDVYFGTFGAQNLAGSLSKLSVSGKVTKLLTAQATFSAVAQHPGTGYYAAVAGGGIYHSSNGTSAWTAVNDGLIDKGVNVLAVGGDGNTLYAGTTTGLYKSTLASSSVADPEESGAALAGEFAPNPARSSTMLTLSLPRRSNVVAEIYSELGEKVATIQSGELPAGRHLLIWDTKEAVNGTYWCRIQGEGLSESRRIVIAR